MDLLKRKPHGPLPLPLQAQRITAPAIPAQWLLPGPYQVRPRWFEVDVRAHHPEIISGLPVHHQRLVAALMQMPKHLVAPIIPLRAGAQEPFHAGDECGLGRLDDQVKMIGHQTPAVDQPAGFLTGLAQGLQEGLAVRVILEKDSRRLPRFMPW
jgi:hypothetical protein